jgi:cytochrome c oxidase subunit 1
MIICWLAIVVLGFLVWGHHMFISGMNPFAGSVFAVATLLITIPSSVLVLCWVASLFDARMQLTTPMLFALGFVSVFVTGGLGGFFLGSAWTDIQLHDTYFVVGHFHFTMAMSPLFALFAGIYYWFPRFFGRLMNEKLGKIHFWFTIAGTYLVFLTMHVLGVGGMIRHTYDPTQYDVMRYMQPLNVVITYSVFVLAASQIFFLFNFFRSLRRGPLPEANPWKVNTLEWQAPTPIPHGNWGDAVPNVHRWPYDYGDIGGEKDYVTQTTAVAEVRS